MKKAETAALNRTGSKLRNFYRSLRFRVKHPIVQALHPRLSNSCWIKHREQRQSNLAQIAEAAIAALPMPMISVVMPSTRRLLSRP
jgi:hypothetical protein